MIGAAMASACAADARSRTPTTDVVAGAANEIAYAARTGPGNDIKDDRPGDRAGAAADVR